MQIYVSRHTKVNIQTGICYGQTEIQLLDSFQMEADLLQKKIPLDLDAVITSPLSRCHLLAKRFCHQPLIEDALLEMNFGDWELQAWDRIDPEQLQTWMDDFVHNSPPNGESMQQLYERVANFMDRLRATSYQKVLLVTHAGVIRCIWAYLLAIPLKNTFKITVDYNRVLVFNLGEHPDYDSIKTM
ncbi:alpha-ribazole phosphatase [Aureispira anguillae]|uniref:Alpha-ribazole phosphatase n=1 Tax=Aureispira anguillae TaxID=2864201 RepID=A0A915YDR8_9BACT|nr:alpha-ribazole phosphatase [Aureispira anguillae]BDS11190.1 alpha-ribazole phosphatase [Aureispira anguillae]